MYLHHAERGPYCLHFLSRAWAARVTCTASSLAGLGKKPMRSPSLRLLEALFCVSDSALFPPHDGVLPSSNLLTRTASTPALEAR